MTNTTLSAEWQPTGPDHDWTVELRISTNESGKPDVRALVDAIRGRLPSIAGIDEHSVRTTDGHPQSSWDAEAVYIHVRVVPTRETMRTSGAPNFGSWFADDVAPHLDEVIAPLASLD